MAEQHSTLDDLRPGGKVDYSVRILTLIVVTPEATVRETHAEFVVLPLYATLERLDKSLLEASADLGARPWKTLTKVVLPLCAPGFRAGALLVFIPCLGAYLTPDLMGGTDSQMIANVIERQFKKANDWPFGAALSFLLIYAMFALIALQSMRKKVPEVR
jgi:spermidine/putrescine transport system permease protein